jgi:Uma2 family endonuclease
MGLPAGKERATYADLEAVPPHRVAELVDGTLHVSPRPAPRHAHAAAALGGELFQPFGRGRGGPGGWWLLIEPELHLTSDVLVPDVAGWRREHMPSLPETSYFALAPEWVCEILSPSTEALDRAEKMPIYARAGVGHAWLVDPLLETLELFVLGADQRWVLSEVHRGHRTVRAEPFEAIELELGVLWAR